MRWLYQKIAERGNIVEYAYSRESDNLTGRIVFDKSCEQILSFAPCTSDTSGGFAEDVACSKFITHVVGEGYPDRRWVVTG